MAEQRTTLITGASGKIGRRLIRALQNAEELHLRAAARGPEAAQRLRANGIEVIPLDLDQPETYASALADVHTLFLTTGYDSRMLQQSLALIDAAVAHGVQHVVHVGAWARPGAVLEPACWHQQIEAAIEASGLGFTHLHPNHFMQNLLGMTCVATAGGGALYHYLGDARVSWVDVDDIAAVAAAVLRDPAAHAGRAYPLATEAHSMSDISRMAGDILGLVIQPVSHSPRAFEAALVAGGMEPGFARALANTHAALQEQDVPEAADTFDTVSTVANRTAVTMHDFIERHRTHFIPHAPQVLDAR